MSFVTYVICKTPAKLRLSFEIHKKKCWHFFLYIQDGVSSFSRFVW